MHIHHKINNLYCSLKVLKAVTQLETHSGVQVSDHICPAHSLGCKLKRKHIKRWIKIPHLCFKLSFKSLGICQSVSSKHWAFHFFIEEQLGSFLFPTEINLGLHGSWETQKREMEQPWASALLVGRHGQSTGLLQSQLLFPVVTKKHVAISS